MSIDIWYEKEIKQMLKEVAKANSVEEVSRLFDRILTSRELNDMGRRLKVLRMLEEGKTYLEIQEAVKVSPSIISRVGNKIGFGFRRSSKNIKKVVVNKKSSSRKYKGATPITQMLKK